jgi:tetratricopeptide (TPR) repeat protein
MFDFLNDSVTKLAQLAFDKACPDVNKNMENELIQRGEETNKEEIKSKTNPDSLPDKNKRLFKRTIIPDIYENKNIILFGESGLGKTTAAIEYGHEQFKKNGRIVLFFNCQNETQFENEYKNIVNFHLGLTDIENINLKKSITQIEQKFIEISRKCKLIFIFDDLVDYKTIEKFITQLLDVEEIKIIITTRFELYQIIWKYEYTYKKIELKPFTSEEAFKYINDELKQTPLIDHTDEDIKELVQVLGDNKQCKPFIINHAIDIILDIKKTKLKTINELTQIIKEDEKTWSHKFYDLVSTDNDDIKRMFKYFIYLDNKSIHIDVLSKLMDKLPDHLTPSVNKLENNSVIKFKSQSVFEIHSLTIKDLEGYVEFKDNEKLELENKLINELNGSFPLYKKGAKYLQDKYYNHVEEFISKSSNNDEQFKIVLANISYKLGKYYEMSCNFIKAMKYLEIEKDIRKNINNPNIAASLNNIGSVYQSKNDYDEALRYYNQSLDMYRAIYGNINHLDIANSLNNIGSVYDSKNDYDKALRYYNQSLDINRAIHGNINHPDIAVILDNIRRVHSSNR